MIVNFRVLSCLLLLIIFSGVIEDAFAKTRLKVFRVNIIHYNNSRTKGILFDVREDGIILAQVKDVVSIPHEVMIKRIKEGLVPVIHVPFDQVKKVGLWRRRAVGRNILIAAASSMVVVGAVVAINSDNRNNDDDFHCGCGGPPAGFILVPAAGILGGTVGALVGVLPKKVVVLNPDKLFESAREQLGKFSITTQLQ